MAQASEPSETAASGPPKPIASEPAGGTASPEVSPKDPEWVLWVLDHPWVLLVAILGIQGALGASSYALFDDWTARGTFGDMFGAINTLFSGLAFAGVIYAILMQRQELQLQRFELSQSRTQFELGNRLTKLELLNAFWRRFDAPEFRGIRARAARQLIAGDGALDPSALESTAPTDEVLNLLQEVGVALANGGLDPAFVVGRFGRFARCYVLAAESYIAAYRRTYAFDSAWAQVQQLAEISAQLAPVDIDRRVVERMLRREAELAPAPPPEPEPTGAPAAHAAVKREEVKR